MTDGEKLLKRKYVFLYVLLHVIINVIISTLLLVLDDRLGDDRVCDGWRGSERERETGGEEGGQRVY